MSSVGPDGGCDGGTAGHCTTPGRAHSREEVIAWTLWVRPWLV